MQPLFIGPYEMGVQRNMKPFMIPEQAFPDLENAFIWRGRIERKAGFQNLGRLRRLITAQNLAAIPLGTPATINIKSQLSITETNATLQTGFSIVFGAQTLTDSGTGTLAIAPAGDVATATINYNTWILTLTYNAPIALTPVFTGAYFPGLPVMGIRTRDIQGVINNDSTIFFDTVYAYKYTGADFEELNSTLAVTWSGSDSDQFQSTNFEQRNSLNLFWATNNNDGLHSYIINHIKDTGGVSGAWTAEVTTDTATNFSADENVSLVHVSAGLVSPLVSTYGIVTTVGNPFVITVDTPTTPFAGDVASTGIASGDPLITQNNASQDGIRLYDGTTWYNFNPAVNGIYVLLGALLVVAYKGRMVVLNTIEGNNTLTPPLRFGQRARWSQNGTSWLGGIGWRDDIPGNGGYVDAATNEQIIAAEFVKDNLIVYFERSTWQLVYTQNEILPFTWLRINAELGAESSSTAVRFDNGILALGNVGIHNCNGVSVQRIDEVIPDEVFDIHNGTDGPKRSSAVRDYYQEIVYFAITGSQNNTPDSAGKTFFPNKMLIYNYRNNSFAFTDDSATAFGYFQRTTGLTWAQLDFFTWEAWNTMWNSGVLSAGFQSVAFGNQQGFVNLIIADVTYAQPSLMVQNISGSTVTSPQHNLFQGQYVYFTDMIGSVNLNDSIYRITHVTDEDTFTIDGTATGTYAGNGVMALVPNINIATKEFTPFWENGQNYSMRYFDVLVDRTSAGQLDVDVYIDFDRAHSITKGSSTLGTSVMSTAPENSLMPYYSFQQSQEQIWKRYYVDALGQTFQVVFSYNDTQMRSPAIAFSDVVIHAMIFFFEPAGAFI